MPSGYIQVHAYAGRAELPLENVAISVTTGDGTALALRLTDRSGKIVPIQIPTPAIGESLSPDPDQIPFTPVTLHARLEGYEQITINGLQVFDNTVTWQDLVLIPLSELPESWDQAETFPTPPQSL